MDRLPGMGQLPPRAQAQLDGALYRRMEVIIDSMTPQERHFPDIINGSRKRRIANGSGTRIQGREPTLEAAQADAEDDAQGDPARAAWTA